VTWVAEPDVDLPAGYADAAPLYIAAGWAGVLPVPARTKEIDRQVVGYTGRTGSWPTRRRVDVWRQFNPDSNLAVRLPRDVLGIDLDLWKNPTARVELEEHLGAKLPPTWCSTSRVDGSGIRLYRVPPAPKGKRWACHVPGVDIIRHEHRYVMAWPSIHPLGAPYRWIDEASGEIADGPPHYDDLTELPFSMMPLLLEDDPDYAPREPVRFELLDGDPSASVARHLAMALDACAGQKGSRHDNVRDKVAALVRLAERGDPGVPQALARLEAAFVASVAPDRPGKENQARREFEDMVTGAKTIVASTKATIPTHQEREEAHRIETELGDLRLAPGEPASARQPGQEDEQPPSRIQRNLYFGPEILALPPVEWLVDGILQTDGLSMIYGPPKSYKSFLALDLALHVTNGREWRGIPVRQTNVLYIAAEGAPGVGPRVEAWCRAHDGVLEGIVWITVAPDLFTRTDSRDEVDEVAQIAARHECGLVFVDTLARSIPGAEENSARDMGVVVAHLDHIRLVANCNVTGVHHTGKDRERGMRGSSAIHGAVDTGLAVVGDRHAVNMQLVDQKNAESGQSWWWKPRQAHGSVVLDPSSGADAAGGDDGLELNLLKRLEALDDGSGVPAGTWQKAAKDHGHCSDTTFKERIKVLQEERAVERLGKVPAVRYRLTALGCERLSRAVTL